MANTSILAAFERMWHHVVTALGNKSDIEHTHDGYATSNDFNELEDAINTSIEDIKNGDIVVKESEHATSADTATNAVNAQTANEATHATSADSATNANHATSSDTATSATSATSATKATQDGNGKVISSTYETKTDASAKLSEAKQYTDTAVSGKADSDHTHDDRYFTESEITIKLAGKSDTGHNHNTAYDAKGTAEEKANAVQANLDVVSDELTDHVDNADIHVTAAKKTNWDKAYTHSQATHARTDATKVSGSTTNGNILINGTETNVYSHPSSGVTAGTYKSVTVNAQGHVTGGSNPTTLAGYGITDAESKGAANTALNSAKEYTDSEVSKKADSEHTHDGRYYTESEIDTKLSGKSDTSHNHNSAYDPKGTASSAVSTHNTAKTAHSDIRDLITGLTTRLNTLANSTDEDLDQMAEIVAYIKSNKSLIDSITTSKVNVADIIDNLTTNVTNKPLSAAQGVAIKALIDALQEEVDSKADSSALTSHTGNTSNPHSVTKAQVGLGNVENKSSATIRGEITKANVTTALGYTPYTPTEVDDLLDGKSDDGHGHAIADVSGLQSALDGKAASSHGTHVSFDSTNKPKMDGTAAFGTSSKVARADHVHPTDTTRAAQTSLDSHTGDTTVHITSTERTNWNAAKTHADSAHAPSNAQANVIESIKVNGTAQTITSKAVDITVPTKASDIGAASSSHGTHVTWSTTTPKANGTAVVGSETKVARGDHVHPTDTTRAAKTDFDSHTGNTTAHITADERTTWNTHVNSTHAPSNAQANQNAFSNVKVGTTTIAADTTTDTLTLAGSNVTITPDATNDKVTFSVADGSTSAKGVVQLTNSTSSTSTTTAATPSSVKSAYDLANTAKTNAATAQTRADNAYTLAESKADSLSDLGVTATAAELNYMDGVTSNVQTQLDGKSASGHTHNYAGSSNAGGAATSANKVNKSLTVKLNGGTTEGTDLFTFNGSTAKSINITPSAIGASASGHIHDDIYYTESEVDSKLSGKANTSHGNHVPATETANNAKFLRNDNTWATVTPANIGAAASSHNHAASNITSGTLSSDRLPTVPIAKGGTNATTLAGVKTNLEIPTLKEVTQAEYDALATKDSNTAYFVSDGIEDVSDVEVGNTYIGDVGDGTVTGAIATLNTNSALKSESFIPKRTLTSDDDLNTLYEPGIYSFATASIPANSPFSNGSIVEVIYATDARIIQRVTRYGKAGQSAERILFGTDWLTWVIDDEASTTTTANYVGGNINFVRKNGMCLVSYLNDWNNIPSGNLGVIGTIPEGYRPTIGVLTMCNPYNDIQVTFYPDGNITAYNYGNTNSGASAGRFSICYPV